MTYTAGSTIVASDYNGFANVTANANVNDVWAVGSTDKGWGQTANVGQVAIAGTVTATQWANLVNTITAMGAQTNTTITSRTAPTLLLALLELELELELSEFSQSILY